MNSNQEHFLMKILEMNDSAGIPIFASLAEGVPFLYYIKLLQNHPED